VFRVWRSESIHDCASESGNASVCLRSEARQGRSAASSTDNAPGQGSLSCYETKILAGQLANSWRRAPCRGSKGP